MKKTSEQKQLALLGLCVVLLCLAVAMFTTGRIFNSQTLCVVSYVVAIVSIYSFALVVVKRMEDKIDKESTEADQLTEELNKFNKKVDYVETVDISGRDVYDQNGVLLFKGRKVQKAFSIGEVFDRIRKSKRPADLTIKYDCYEQTYKITIKNQDEEGSIILTSELIDTASPDHVRTFLEEFYNRLSVCQA